MLYNLLSKSVKQIDEQVYMMLVDYREYRFFFCFIRLYCIEKYKLHPRNETQLSQLILM